VALDRLRPARACSAMVEKEKECDGFLQKFQGLTESALKLMLGEEG